MKKTDMVNKIKETIEKTESSVNSWYEMLEDELNKMGKTFEEALEDGTAYGMLEYRVWIKEANAYTTLKLLAEDLGIK